MITSFKKNIDKYYIHLVTLTVIAALIATLSVYKKPLSLIPNTPEFIKAHFDIGTYADDAEGGRSTASAAVVSDSGINYSYVLRKSYDPQTGMGVEYPYAGLSIFADTSLPKIKSLLNVNNYTNIKINASVKNSNAEFVFIKPVLAGYTKFDDKSTWGNLKSSLLIINRSVDTTISFEQFKAPDWWCNERPLISSSMYAPDFSRVVEIIIQNSPSTRFETPIEVHIKEIIFYKDISNIVHKILRILFVIIGFLSLVRFMKLPTKDSNERGKIIIAYDPVEIEDEQSNDLKRIMEQISSNYQNPDFTVEILAKGAGVSTSKIPSLLKKQFSMNFKQYLNTVRIAEAKRLLLETDHQIVTIAHSVGYNNIPHFNRTFKQITGLSPKQFREHPENATDLIKELLHKREES